MPFCPSCGTSADGKFCPKCGTAIGAPAGGGFNAPPPPPPPGYQQAGYQAPPPVINAAGLSSNVASALCYILVLVGPIVFLVAEPYKSDRKIRFDAFQGLFLFGAFVAAQVLVNILVDMSYHLYFIYRLLGLAEFGICVFMAIKAFQGEKLLLPIIGPLAEKQA